jgi:hypothetical protein
LKRRADMPHDIDRTQLEYASEVYGEYPGLASEQYEYPGETGTVLESLVGEAQAEGAFESGYQEYQELPLPEVMEDELASELLEVSNEQELDHFLGNLFNKIAGTIGRVIKSPVGQALGGVLKQVAKKALPIAGGALGTFVGGPMGGMVGSKLASMAGDAFGLEYEGLSPEDRDFERAKRYVRFAGHAAKKAALAPPQVHPDTVAKAAVEDAAKKFAPGLLAPVAGVAAAAATPTVPPAYAPAYPTGAAGAAPTAPRPVAPGVYPPTGHGAPAEPTCACPTCGGTRVRHGRQGKWIRRGRHIVLLGV